MMHYLDTNYALYFNKKYKTVGHVYQGRFISKPILSETYLFTVLRYIHRNPEKSGIVDKAIKYTFSSDSAYRGKKSLIEVDKLSGFEGKSGIKHYEEFMSYEVDEELVEYKGCLGTKAEYEKFEKRQRKTRPVVERRERRDVESEVKKTLKEEEKLYLVNGLRSSSKNHKLSKFRKQLIFALFNKGFKNREIARYFQRSEGYISKTIRKMLKSSKSQPPSPLGGE